LFLSYLKTKQQTRLYFQPEWYLTQIIEWIRGHFKFLIQKIQPIVDEFYKPRIIVTVIVLKFYSSQLSESFKF
jgi:hypothetical protein